MMQYSARGSRAIHVMGMLLALAMASACSTESSGDDDDDAAGGGAGGDVGGAPSGGDGGSNQAGAGGQAGGAGGQQGGAGGQQAGAGGTAMAGMGGDGGMANLGGSPITEPPPQFTPVMLTEDMVSKLKATNVAKDLGNLDGLLWDKQTQTLLYYRVDTNKMVRFDPADLSVEPFDTPAPGNPAYDQYGTLVTAGNKKLSRIKRTGELIETLATKIGNRAGITPTDVIVRPDGNIYFVDGTDRLEAIVRYSPDKQTTSFVMQDAPRGVVLGLDGNSLLVSDRDARNIMKYDLAGDGARMGNGSEFANHQGFSAHNGLCIDYAGHVFLITHNGIIFFSPSGQFLGRVQAPAHNDVYFGNPNDCSFGGADQKTLFVGGNKRDGSIVGLYHVDLPNPGPP